MKTPFLIAHRGGRYPGMHHLEVERCIEASISNGIIMVEVDLRRMGDGELVIEHDPEIAGLRLASASYPELDRHCQRVGLPTPPVASHILKRFSGSIRFDLELKERGTEAQVLELARTHLPQKGFVLKSFQDKTVRELKERAPSVQVGLLLGVGDAENLIWTRVTEIFPEWRLKGAGADFVAPHHRLLRLPGFAGRMRMLGLPIWVWTVNEPELALQVAPLADAIITDHPVEIRGALKAR